MLLKNKTAVIFGAGGAIGSQVARTLAGKGASVFLSGRHLEPVEAVAKEIRALKGIVDSAEVDALNEKAVNTYLGRVVKQAGKIDIVFNAMGRQPVEYDNGVPSTEVSFENFLIPLTTHPVSQFLTARAAARHMIERRSGVVVFLSASPAVLAVPFIAGIAASFGAIEGMMRCLATEWGPVGIRVVCVRPSGMPETRGIQQTLEIMARSAGIPKEVMVQSVKEKPLLKRMATVAETAEVVAWMASDRASSITGAIINASCGEVLD